MGGELTKLSETRWRYATGQRVYYVRQAKAPNEDLHQLGVYQVDGGGEDVRWVMAESVEQIASELRQAQRPAKPRAQATIPW